MSPLTVPNSAQRLAVMYLARGADPDPLDRFRRFVRSYLTFRAGVEHELFIIFKGFADQAALGEAKDVFRSVSFAPLYTDDVNFDLGAYRSAAEQVPHERICFLNSNSEIRCADWLLKLAANFSHPDVGIVGATGSFESLWQLDYLFPRFPNVHMRSNAFLMRREHIISLLPQTLKNKKEAFFVESGPNSITRRLFEIGLSAMIVGRSGRGYPPQWWASSRTFRQGVQEELIVHDNVTREYDQLSFAGKVIIARSTWGDYLRQDPALLLPEQLAV